MPARLLAGHSAAHFHVCPSTQRQRPTAGPANALGAAAPSPQHLKLPLCMYTCTSLKPTCRPWLTAGPAGRSADAPPSAAPAAAPTPAGGRLLGGGTAGGKAKESLACSLGAGSVVRQRHQLQQAAGCRVARQGTQHKAGRLAAVAAPLSCRTKPLRTEWTPPASQLATPPVSMGISTLPSPRRVAITASSSSFSRLGLHEQLGDCLCSAVCAVATCD